MASENYGKRKCFTFIWKIENASYCWQKECEYIDSPLFTVDEINETNWKLRLYPSIERNYILFYLIRQTGNDNLYVTVDCELACLLSDGKVLCVFAGKNLKILTNGFVGTPNVASRNEVFTERKSVFLPQDTLTARCRIWKSDGEMSKDVQCCARTRIAVEKKSFLWRIENFSSLKSHGKRIYEIKSHGNNKKLMSLELFLSGGLHCDETVRFKIIPIKQNMKIATFQFSIVDASKNTGKVFKDEFWYGDPCDSKDFTLFCTKKELVENKNAYLPNDALSLWCECAFPSEIILEEIETTNTDCDVVEEKKSLTRYLGEENEIPVPKRILLDDLKSMLSNSCVSDVKLKTKSQTYPAHTFILSARSPVFKAMFSSDMKEKINECVNIEDFNDDTVLRMLQYIYSAEVNELEWSTATDLYEAADMYQILSLKDICSSYVKSNLCANNACEALILADLHHDEDLRGFVQDFVLRYGEDIFPSEEWEQLAKTNLKLAYETMRLKYKKNLK